MRAKVAGFPPGAKVYIDGRDIAFVRGYWPKGSTSYAFPHYTVNMQHDLRQTAVAVARVGVVRRKNNE
jgi:hypothetical protein